MAEERDALSTSRRTSAARVIRRTPLFARAVGFDDPVTLLAAWAA
jgi:hypothetical protein